VTRLCYAGNVLHTKPSGLHATREPIQIGAEIYGHAGLEADAEIQELVIACLRLAGIEQVPGFVSRGCVACNTRNRSTCEATREYFVCAVRVQGYS
jgi:histidyl-tRNA synthetase